MWLTNSVLREILFNENNVCCLCLKVTEENAFHVQDAVFLNDQIRSIKMYDIIRVVFGSLLPDIELPSKTVCNGCAKSTLDAFKFVKKCTEINEQLKSVLSNITSPLEEEQVHKSRVKELYIATDPVSLQCKVICSSKAPVTSSIEATKRFQAILQTIEFDDRIPSFYKKFKVECENCGLVCGNKNAFNKHRLICLDSESEKKKVNKTNLPRETCEYCHRIFRNKYSLRYHMKTFCTIIKNKFNQIIDKNVSEHDKKYLKGFAELLLESKGIAPRHESSVCTDCGKVVRNLEKHHSTHIKRFICHKCGKSFKTEVPFKKHLNLPNCKEKPLEFIQPSKNYRCDICAAPFHSGSSLRMHIQARHTETGFECHLCKKKLSSKSYLKTHLELTHTQRKDFECEICGGKFVTKHSLLYHTRTHTGEKPYKCKFCEKRFLSASRRSTHIRTNHLPPQLECKMCTKKFTNWGGLSRHRKRHLNPKSSLFLPGEANSKVTTEFIQKYSDSESD